MNQAKGRASTPAEGMPLTNEANKVVPDPQKGSKT